MADDGDSASSSSSRSADSIVQETEKKLAASRAGQKRTAVRDNSSSSDSSSGDGEEKDDDASGTASIIRIDSTVLPFLSHASDDTFQGLQMWTSTPQMSQMHLAQSPFTSTPQSQTAPAIHQHHQRYASLPSSFPTQQTAATGVYIDSLTQQQAYMDQLNAAPATPNVARLPALQMPPPAKNNATETNTAKKKKTGSTKKKKKKSRQEEPVAPVASKKSTSRQEEKAKSWRKSAKAPLPPELCSFTFEMKKHLELGEEVDEKRARTIEKRIEKAAASGKPLSENDLKEAREQMDEVQLVAQYITVRKGKPGERKFVLAELNSSQIRTLAANFGCRKCGSESMFFCRREMALRCTMGTAYDNMVIPNATSTKNDLLVNTMMRIVNAVFHPEFLTTFLTLNDTKRRKELEQAGGGSPLKAFWLNLSEFVNDSENNEILSVVLDADEGGDEWLHGVVENDPSLNLNDFNQGTHKSCAKHMMNLMRARNNIRRDMKISGTHAPHPESYRTEKNLKVSKKCTLPGLPVVYLDIQCMKHDSIDATHATVIHEYLKGCSMGDDELLEDETLSRSTTNSVKQDEFMAQFKDISLDMEKHQVKANQQREEYLAIQRDLLKRNTEAAKAALWDEYIRLSETVARLKSTQNDALLESIANRVREVEGQIGVADDKSIVKDVQR